jgi:replicative DNA helicase
MNLQQKQAELEMQQFIATQNNQTKMAIAQLQADNKASIASLATMPEDGVQEPMSESDREKLREQVREFNERLKLDTRKLDLQETKQSDDKKIKLKQVNNKK